MARAAVKGSLYCPESDPSLRSEAESSKEISSDSESRSEEADERLSTSMSLTVRPWLEGNALLLLPLAEEWKRSKGELFAIATAWCSCKNCILVEFGCISGSVGDEDPSFPLTEELNKIGDEALAKGERDLSGDVGELG